MNVNGVPVVTLELKNPLSGQTVADAIHQYRNDRDPREKMFEFKKRSLVHFSVDTEEVHMATRLVGTATHFLPFNRGRNGGAGNPPDPEGRNYRTAYLWEEVLQYDSLLDLGYYRLQKISEGSISLGEGTAKPLDGPRKVGTGMVREEAVPLSSLIDIINERFGAELTEADQLFFDQLAEAWQ